MVACCLFLEFALQASFNGEPGEAVIVSPLYYVSTSTCLSFLFKITTNLVRLYVNVSYDDSMSTLISKSFVDQIENQDWNQVSVEINNGFKQIIFIAETVNSLFDDSVVRVTNVTITSEICPGMALTID